MHTGLDCDDGACMITPTMKTMVVQIAGVLLLVGTVGCGPRARCPVLRSRPPDPSANLLDSLLSLPSERPTGQRIVVARVRLAAGTPLRTSLLRVIPKPAGLKWAGHLRPVDLVHFAGRRLRRDIGRGVTVKRGDLEGVGDARRVGRVKVPLGGRTVTLRVDWVGGAGTWVQPGDHVDVAVVARARGRGPLAVRMLMQAARVVAAERLRGARAVPSRGPWCTVLALPREAQALALAQRLGRIVLFRRSNRDRRRVVYQPVTRKNLENPRFWRDLRRNRLRTIQRHGLPDDPGVGPKIRMK
jgi:Flp pilus assembly protein CpaB